jgi:hypothetical protein
MRSTGDTDWQIGRTLGAMAKTTYKAEAGKVIADAGTGPREIGVLTTKGKLTLTADDTSGTWTADGAVGDLSEQTMQSFLSTVLKDRRTVRRGSRDDPAGLPALVVAIHHVHGCEVM